MKQERSGSFDDSSFLHWAGRHFLVFVIGLVLAVSSATVLLIVKLPNMHMAIAIVLTTVFIIGVAGVMISLGQVWQAIMVAVFGWWIDRFVDAYRWVRSRLSR